MSRLLRNKLVETPYKAAVYAILASKKAFSTISTKVEIQATGKDAVYRIFRCQRDQTLRFLHL